jgi:CheY-like chemotaxis protein
VPTKTVLIADDTTFVRERFAAALVEAGHRAVAVASATELMGALGELRLDLILLDLRVPLSRGLPLVGAIQERTQRSVPLLVFSGTIASASEVRELSKLGVAGYINEYSATHHIMPALAPHLFPDSFNRRSGPRVALSLPISWRVGNSIATGVTMNLAVDTRLHVRLRLPGLSEIEAPARVAWSDARQGMGVQFLRLDAYVQTALDDYVDRAFFTSRRT